MSVGNEGRLSAPDWPSDSLVNFWHVKKFWLADSGFGTDEAKPRPDFLTTVTFILTAPALGEKGEF